MKTTTILLAIALGGCALTSKSDALDIRWYSPETVRPRLTSAGPEHPAGPALELGHIWAGYGLREKIAYRASSYEVGYHEDKRWTERPEVYVRRALARTLFEERGLARSLSGGAPTLDVEVLAFEELHSKPPVARVQLRVVLHDDRAVRLEKTITVDRPAAGGSARGYDEFVQAMAAALDATSEEVASDVTSALTAR